MPKRTKSQDLISHSIQSINNSIFHQRKCDGYINATEFCKAHNRVVGEFLRLPSTQEYVSFLTKGFSLSIKPIFTKEGKNGGTWIHPKLAIHLGQWISVEMMDFVSELVLSWMSGEKPKHKRTRKQNPDAGEKRQEVIPTTKELNQTIHDKLCQPSERTYQHVENTIHSVITGMSASHHKKAKDAKNSVDLLCRVELDLYDMVKRMIQRELEDCADASLTREQIRSIAKDIGERCSLVVQANEQVGSISYLRHADILPKAQKRLLQLRTGLSLSHH